MNCQPHISSFLFGLTLVIGTGCKENDAPPAITHPPDYLVVEGFIENNCGDLGVAPSQEPIFAPHSGNIIT